MERLYLEEGEEEEEEKRKGGRQVHVVKKGEKEGRRKEGKEEGRWKVNIAQREKRG